MKLVKEIIDILSSEKPNISNALMKTKVLLFRMGEKEITNWVNNELNGYENISEIPMYRIVPSRVMANSMNLGYSITNHEVPIYHLDEEIRTSLEKSKFGNSIAALENLVESDTENNGVQRQIPIIMYRVLGEKLASDYKIQEAWCEIPKNSLVQILTEVRSRLLDFILELEAKLPNELNESDLKEASKDINAKSLFNHTVIGDNATILFGNNNHQTISNSIEKENFDSLSSFLKKHEVSEEDIMLLKEAISNDKELINETNKEYGPSVKKWLNNMFTKAVDASWNVEMGIASSLLATGLNNYYGWL